MRYNDKRRSGISLIEVIVVLGILALIIGLVLVAIQNVRITAIRSQNINNHRQMILAVHQLAGQKEEKITDLAKSSMPGLKFSLGSQSLFNRMLPYVHGPVHYSDNMTGEQLVEFLYPEVKVYRNIADPSWDYEVFSQNKRAKCSYAINMFAFDGSISLIASVSDGSSQTIAIADKFYSRCTSDSQGASTYHDWTHVFDPMDFSPIDGRPYLKRRPTFADTGWKDVLPVVDPTARLTRPSFPGKTFQVRPRPEDVDPSILQTAFTAGLTVAMFDGSVRTIRPGIDETVFWALVTPRGGEVVSLD
jgi:type II secretory pathway pseudopilin PulG